MDLKELQKQFDKISKQVEKETKSQPALALLFTSFTSTSTMLFDLLNVKNEEQSKKIDELNNLFKSNIEHFSFLYKDIQTGFTISYNEKSPIFTASNQNKSFYKNH